MIGCFAPPVNFICGYTDPNCTCASTCGCRDFTPCRGQCCYRTPSVLFRGPPSQPPRAPTPASPGPYPYPEAAQGWTGGRGMDSIEEEKVAGCRCVVM